MEFAHCLGADSAPCNPSPPSSNFSFCVLRVPTSTATVLVSSTL
uniref:Uncharacterized protein n=1 Tax=Rhizophora mucronata TaxID=61149 RepID=A0A2P2N6U7_RHIMU